MFAKVAIQTEATYKLIYRGKLQPKSERHGPVVQRITRLTTNQEIAGSNPAGSATFRQGKRIFLQRKVKVSVGQKKCVEIKRKSKNPP